MSLLLNHCFQLDLFNLWGMIRQLDYIVMYLLFQHSFQVDLFDYAYDLGNWISFRFAFCSIILLNLISFTSG